MCVDWFIFLFVANLVSLASSEEIWQQCGQLFPDFAIPSNGGYYESIGCNYSQAVGLTSANELVNPATVLISEGNIVGDENSLSILISNILGSPLHITIRKMNFFASSILRVIGALPPLSTLSITNNYFELNSVVGGLSMETLTTILMEVRNRVNISINDNEFVFNVDSAAIRFNMYHLLVSNHSGLTISRNTGTIPNSPVSSEMFSLVKFWLVGISSEISSSIVFEGNTLDGGAGARVCTICFAPQSNQTINVTSNSSFIIASNTLSNSSAIMTSAVEFISAATLFIECTESGTFIISQNMVIDIEGAQLAHAVVWKYQEISMLIASSSTMSMSNNIAERLSRIDNVFSLYLACVRFYADVTVSSTLRFDGNRLAALTVLQASVVFLNVLETLIFICRTSSEITFSNNSAHSARLPSGNVYVVFVISQFDLLVRSIRESSITFSNNSLVASTSASAICVALAANGYANNQSTTATVAAFQKSRITVQRNTIIRSTATLSLRVIVWDFRDLLTILRDASAFLVQNNLLLDSSSSSAAVVDLHGGSLSVTTNSAAIFDVSSNHASSYAGEIYVVRILSDSVSLITVLNYSVLSVSGNSVMRVSSTSIVTGVLLSNVVFTISVFASVSLSNNSLLNASCSVATVLMLYASSPAQLHIGTGSSFAVDNNTGSGLTSDSIHGAFMYFMSSLSIRVRSGSTLSVSRNFVLDSVAQEFAVASIVTAQLFYGSVTYLSTFSFDLNMLRNVTSQSASISGITSLTQSTLTVIEASTVSFNDNCATNLTATYLYVVGFIAAHLQYSVESSSHFELKRNSVEGCNLMSGSLFCVLFKITNRLQLDLSYDAQFQMMSNAILASAATNNFVLIGFQSGNESSAISIAFQSQLIVEDNTIFAAIASAALHVFLFNGSGLSNLSYISIQSNSQIIFKSNIVSESSSEIETVMICITSINSLLVSTNSSLRVTDSNIAGTKISLQAQLFVVQAQTVTVNDSSSMVVKNSGVFVLFTMAPVVECQVSEILVDANSLFLITQIQTTAGLVSIVSLSGRSGLAGATLTIRNFSAFNLSHNSAHESRQNYRIDLSLTQIRIQSNSLLIVTDNVLRQTGHNNGSVVAFGQISAGSPNCRMIIANNIYQFVAAQPQRCPPEAITISTLTLAIPGPRSHHYLISNNQFSCTYAPITDVCTWIGIGALLISNVTISQNQFKSETPFKVVISRIQSIAGAVNSQSSFTFSQNTISFVTTRELGNFTFLSVMLLYIGIASWFEISENTVWATNVPPIFLLLEAASVAGQPVIRGCGNKVNGMTMQGNELITPASNVDACTITVTTSVTLHSLSLTRMLLTRSAEVEDSHSLSLITYQAPRTVSVNVIDSEVGESEIIPVPVPAGTSAAVSVAASALGGVATAVDAQAIATIGLVACAQQDPAKPHGDLRALSIVALDNTCEGVLQGNSIALLLAALASMTSVAVAHLIFKRRRVHDESSTPPSAIVNAFALVRSPQLFLTGMVYFMNSFAVCGMELARGPKHALSLRAAGGLAFAVPVTVVFGFPVLTFLFASRRLLSVRYSAWPKPLCWVGAFTLPSYALDPALQTDKLFGCVFGSYRRLGCMWSLSSHISFIAGLPMIVASGPLCQPFFALSASLYFAGAATILVFRPRRVAFADILHGSMLVVNGLAASSATELVGSTSSPSPSRALSLEQIGTVVTILTAIRLTHSVASVVFGVINRRGIISGVETLDLETLDLQDDEHARSPQFGWLPSLAIRQSNYTGFLWPASINRVSLDLQDAEPAMLLVELLAGGEPSFSMPLASPPPIGTPMALTPEPTQVTQEAVVLPQVRLASQRAAFEVANTELYLTEEERFRRELAMEYASRQISELSLSYDK